MFDQYARLKPQAPAFTSALLSNAKYVGLNLVMKIVLTVLYALAAVLAVLCGLFFALCPLLGLSRAFDMDWYYVVDSQQRGPVPEDRLDELLRSGAITGDTLVWRDGLADWQPLHAARPAALAPESTPPAAPRLTPAGTALLCAECRRQFPQTDLVLLNHSWVCAQCKPLFLQRLAEGAPPPQPVGLAWRSNRQMILRPETALPDRCVRCNAPANGFRLKRNLYWHPPLYYLLILINILVYAIVALCIRKKAVIHIGLCETHRAQRKWFIAGSWLAALLGLILLIAGIAENGGYLILFGIILLLGAAICGAAKGPVVSPAKIDREFVWVKGVGQSFLADLPEWSGPR